MNKLKPLFLVSLAVILSGCEKQNAAAPAAGGMPPAQVTSTKVEPRDIPVNYSYTGQIAASHEVEVRARVSGIIEKRLYEEGSLIKEGDLLFTIERAPFEAIMAEAQAALVSAKAAKTTAKAQLKKAQRDYARVMPLANRKLLSQSAKDDAESALEIAKAAMSQADATILQAQAAMKSVQINLDYTNVKAPISGIAGRATKLQGSLVQVGSDSLLTLISQTDPAYVNFGIPEPQHISQQQEIGAGTLQIPDSGFKVALTSSNGQQLPQTGVVSFEDYKTDPQTGNFAVRATVENPKRRLSPGQFVRVNLIGAVRPNAIVVPQRSVLDNPQGKYVYVVGKMKGKDNQEMTIAEQRPVEVGEWVKLEGDLENAWVIKSGLKEGDEVITEGSARIFFPGMPIQATTVTDAADKTEPSNPKTVKAKQTEQKDAEIQTEAKIKTIVEEDNKLSKDPETLMSTELKNELEREMNRSTDSILSGESSAVENDDKKSLEQN